MNRLILISITLLLPLFSSGQTAEDNYKKAKECYNKKEYREAFILFEKSANQGYVDAKYNLGMCYYFGNGVPQNYEEAFKWWEDATEQGSMDALIALEKYGARAEYNKGCDYYYGHNGVVQDYAEAVKWWKESAKKGSLDAMCAIGNQYYKGEGVSKDYTEAVKWYRKAAEQGRKEAQYYLGDAYYKGEGVIKDHSEAVQWYRKAADQGYAPAQNCLGDCYNNGEFGRKNYAEAFKWYQKAADQGYAPAQNRLGDCYYKGRGVSEDDAEAFKWYQKAAEQGYAEAQCNLGICYYLGNGVNKDYSKALKWYREAAEQEDVTAMNNLGELYESGSGVTQNYQMAQKWYQKALNKDPNYDKAKSNLAAIEIKIAKQQENNYTQTTTIHPDQPSQTTIQLQSKVESNPIDTDIPSTGRLNENTFAIIIANEDYQNEVKVDYAKNDGEVFKHYCHKTLGLPEKNVHFVANATLNNIIGELYWLQQVCEKFHGEASVIFYYAGHGIPDESSGSAYMLPTDGNSRMLRTCFSIKELYETLGKMSAKKVIVLMDACFSGAVRNGGMLASARGVAIKAKTGTPMGNMIVLSAAQGNETAYKYQNTKHGLFTYFLLKKLKDTKGMVTMGELSSYLQDQVGRYSIVENGKSQTPSVQTSDALRTSWQDITFY